MYLELIREYPPTDKEVVQTLGRLTVMLNGIPAPNIQQFVTVEPAWRDNEVNVSCIPPGWYNFQVWDSNKFQRLVFTLMAVPNRTFIQMHGGNTFMHTRGCILPGKEFSHLNDDGYRDVYDSWKSIETLLGIFNNKLYNYWIRII